MVVVMRAQEVGLGIQQGHTRARAVQITALWRARFWVQGESRLGWSRVLDMRQRPWQCLRLMRTKCPCRYWSACGQAHCPYVQLDLCVAMSLPY